MDSALFHSIFHRGQSCVVFFLDMDATRAACVRNDLGPPSSVQALAESVMGLIDNAGKVERAEAAVDERSAALHKNAAKIVGLEFKLPE